jgi:hypothetical protein
MLNAFQPNQAPCKLLNFSGFAVHDEHFKAGIVVEMSVAGGDHQLMMRVLQIGQFVGDAMHVVVIDEGHGTDYCGIRVVRKNSDLL